MKLHDPHQAFSETLRGYIIATVCTVGTCSLLFGVAQNTDYQTKAICATGALAFATVGLTTGKTLNDTYEVQKLWGEAILDARDSYIKELARVVETLPLSSQPVAVVPFDWRRLESERNTFAHLMLLGSTGDGKSALAENLAGLFGGTVLGVIPHWEGGEFGSLDLVIGEEMNVGQTALPYSLEPEKGKSQDVEPEVRLEDIISRRVKPTVCQFIRALYNEMKKRYKLDPVTKKRQSGENITVILDEYLSFAKLPGIDHLVMCLVREARKVGIRLIMLVQGDSVKSLGWEGDGYIRENLTYIYLNKWAVDHAKKLRDSKKEETEKAYWIELVNRLEKETYATLVEDDYAVRPNLNQFISSNRNKPLLACSTQSELATLQDSNNSEHSTTVLNSLEYPEQPVITGVSVNPFDAFDLSQDDAFDLYERAVYCGELGWAKGKTIKEDWKFKSEKYRKGLAIWDALETHYGEIPRNNK